MQMNEAVEQNSSQNAFTTQPPSTCSRCRIPLTPTPSSPHGRRSKRPKPTCKRCQSAPSPSHRYPTPEDHQDFTCSGDLKSGGRWGCGRHFGQLRDFAHHLRTRSGRKCIQPLYDEERETKRQQWTAPPSRQSSTDSSLSNGMMNDAQLGDCAMDFTFPSCGSDYDTEGSPQVDLGMPVDNLFISPYLLENGHVRDATLPGTSYMAWWQSYMSAIAASDLPGGFGPNV